MKNVDYEHVEFVLKHSRKQITKSLIDGYEGVCHQYVLDMLDNIEEYLKVNLNGI